MNIELYEGQGCRLYITLNGDFDVYGGTTKQQFTVTKVGDEYLVTIPGQTRSMCYDPRFDIFARRTSSKQEWLVVSGRITLKTRHSAEPAGTISCVEYHISKELVESGEVVDGGTMLIGIKGDTGLSAYDIAKQHGYTGTETEFIDMLETFESAAERAVDAQILAEINAIAAVKAAQEILEQIKQEE